MLKSLLNIFREFLKREEAWISVLLPCDWNLDAMTERKWPSKTMAGEQASKAAPTQECNHTVFDRLEKILEDKPLERHYGMGLFIIPSFSLSGDLLLWEMFLTCIYLERPRGKTPTPTSFCLTPLTARSTQVSIFQGSNWHICLSQ